MKQDRPHPGRTSAPRCVRLLLCGAAIVDRFPDGEVTVHLQEPVRRKEVFIIHPPRRR